LPGGYYLAAAQEKQIDELRIMLLYFLILLLIPTAYKVFQPGPTSIKVKT
jgi:hypothetical protein